MIIDQLFPTASDNLTDEVPVEQGTSTFKTTWQKILNLFAGSSTPAMDGTASAGSASSFSRSDHIHPTDTSRASQSDMTTVQSTLSGKADASSFKGFTVTLSTASWSNNAQTVSNAYFLASGYSYIVSPASVSFADYGSAKIYADNVTTNGQMTFHCDTAPSSNLTVNVQRVVAS